MPEDEEPVVPEAEAPGTEQHASTEPPRGLVNESQFTHVPEWVSEFRRLYVEPKSRAEMRERGWRPILRSRQTAQPADAPDGGGGPFSETDADTFPRRSDLRRFRRGDTPPEGTPVLGSSVGDGAGRTGPKEPPPPPDLDALLAPWARDPAGAARRRVPPSRPAPDAGPILDDLPEDDEARDESGDYLFGSSALVEPRSDLSHARVPGQDLPDDDQPSTPEAVAAESSSGRDEGSIGDSEDPHGPSTREAAAVERPWEQHEGGSGSPDDLHEPATREPPAAETSWGQDRGSTRHPDDVHQSAAESAAPDTPDVHRTSAAAPTEGARGADASSGERVAASAEASTPDADALPDALSDATLEDATASAPDSDALPGATVEDTESWAPDAGGLPGTTVDADAGPVPLHVLAARDDGPRASTGTGDATALWDGAPRAVGGEPLVARPEPTVARARARFDRPVPQYHDVSAYRSPNPPVEEEPEVTSDTASADDSESWASSGGVQAAPEAPVVEPQRPEPVAPAVPYDEVGRLPDTRPHPPMGPMTPPVPAPPSSAYDEAVGQTSYLDAIQPPVDSLAWGDASDGTHTRAPRRRPRPVGHTGPAAEEEAALEPPQSRAEARAAAREADAARRGRRRRLLVVAAVLLVVAAVATTWWVTRGSGPVAARSTVDAAPTLAMAAAPGVLRVVHVATT